MACGLPARQQFTHLETLEGGERGGAAWRKSTKNSWHLVAHVSAVTRLMSTFCHPTADFLTVLVLRDEKQDPSAGLTAAGSRRDPSSQRSPQTLFVFLGLSKQGWEPIRPKDKHFTHTSPLQSAVDSNTANTSLPLHSGQVKGLLMDNSGVRDPTQHNAAEVCACWDKIQAVQGKSWLSNDNSESEMCFNPFVGRLCSVVLRLRLKLSHNILTLQRDARPRGLSFSTGRRQSASTRTKLTNQWPGGEKGTETSSCRNHVAADEMLRFHVTLVSFHWRVAEKQEVNDKTRL